MKNKNFAFLIFVFLTIFAYPVFASDSGQMVPADKARIFITDSQSWEIGAGTGGTNGSFGGAGSGGARPQTAEIVKTFGERCPDVQTNNIQTKADYIVVLDHEGGKSFVLHRNKVAVFTRVTGDSIVSKSTYSLGASVQEACEAVHKDWAKNSESIRSAEAAEAAAKSGPPSAQAASGEMSGTKVTVASMPVGADIEVDGSFVGNTPSTITLPTGDHMVTVSRNGYRTWERKMKSNGGNVNLNVQLEAEQQAAK